MNRGFRNDNDSNFCGLKLENEKCEEICSVMWATGYPDAGSWVYQDIPVGQAIVGIQVGVTDDWISRIGFRMATMHSVE